MYFWRMARAASEVLAASSFLSDLAAGAAVDDEDPPPPEMDDESTLDLDSFVARERSVINKRRKKFGIPRDLPLVIRRPCGFGQTVFVACELDRAPLAGWLGRPSKRRRGTRSQRPPARSEKEETSRRIPPRGSSRPAATHGGLQCSSKERRPTEGRRSANLSQL